MPDCASVQGGRLRAAVTAAFAPLADDGFQVRDTKVGWDRGTNVTVASRAVAIHVDADFLECELSVTVQVTGTDPVPIENLVPAVRGVVGRRLPRAATRGSLQRRLELIVKALRSQAPELLSGGDRARLAALRASARPH